LNAQNYTAQRTTDHGVDVVRLADASHGVEVLIAPSIGNRCYAINVHGGNVLYQGAADVGALKQRPDLSGIPFLAPWANRIDTGGFWCEGRKYNFNGGLGSLNVIASGVAIHGMLSASPFWVVTDVGADAASAHVTSRLDFWKYPDMMANWPFAHEYEITYRLAGGAVEVITTVINRSAAAMPVMVGYHPYFNLPDVPRDDAVAHFAAKTAVIADDRLVATGEMKPMDLPDPTPLKDRTLDNGYTDLIRDGEGRAVFYIEGGGKKIELTFGPKWLVAVAYSPARQNYICIEPMASITNGANLNHDGKYPALQMLAPGATWRESFRIRTSGI
jgi:aldose 1-epimerase